MQLTVRQAIIRDAVLQGQTAKQIAQQLGVTVAAIKDHKTAIYKKEQVKGFKGLKAKYNKEVINESKPVSEVLKQPAVSAPEPYNLSLPTQRAS